MFTLQSRVPVVSWQTPAPVGGALKLTVAGKPGTSYVLESSTNLVNWTAFVTNTIPPPARRCSPTRSPLIPRSAPFARGRVSDAALAEVVSSHPQAD